MILQIQHETCLQYSDPVTEWVAEMRVEPISDERQTCQSFYLRLSEPTAQFHYQDGFGNHVHHFNLLSPQQEVRVLAASLVETFPPRCRLADSRACYPMPVDEAPVETLDFMTCRGPLHSTPLLEPILTALRPRDGMAVGEVVASVSKYIHEHFAYARDVTNASSPIADILQHRKGVCQDFAHLMIAILRSFDLPARYVSGYIHRPNKESQSHAWCEVWLPDLGWVGIDPTNDCLVTDHHVKVASGRDFTDVPPNKGVYRGGGEETILVRVQTRALERLPPLWWQEQLRPLDVPLTAIGRGVHTLAENGEHGQEQQ
jgi:transglutaminase-like putative cysteine protease